MSTNQSVSPKQVGAFLEERVHRLGSNAPIFYGDLAAHLSLPPITDAWFTHPLCGIFEQLDVEDARLGRPFRTALVISRERSMPGQGFFKTYLRLHPHVSPPKTDHDKMRLYLDEVNRVLGYSW
jgi:hypothetical protein